MPEAAMFSMLDVTDKLGLITSETSFGRRTKMVATSLLEVDINEVLEKVERLTNVELPKDVIEVSLEPRLNVLCIRFKKPSKAEFGEPLRHGIHLFTDKDTDEITAIEVVDLEKL